MYQCTRPVRAELRDHWMRGCRVPGAWKADPVHCSKGQLLDLTLLQVMGRSLAGQPEAEV